MPGLFIDTFKVFFLWNTSRLQKQRFKAYAIEMIVVGLLAFIFSAISVGSTALYLMPYTANMIEGAFYAMGTSLQEAGIFDKMVEYSLGFAVGFSLILEVGTIMVFSKFLNIRKKIKNAIIQKDEDISEFKLWGILTAFLVSIQVLTAFGGLMNTYEMLQTSKADRAMLESKKRDLDSIVARISGINKQINAVESGKKQLTDADLAIRAREGGAEIFYKMLQDVQEKLQKARGEHSVYAEKIKAALYKKHYYTKAENKIKAHYDANVAPLEKREKELLEKIASLKSVKTHMTKEEWLKKKIDEIRVLEEQRDLKHKEVKYTEATIRAKVGDKMQMAGIFLLMALTLIVVQSLIANRLEYIKEAYSKYTDGLSGRTSEGQIKKARIDPNIELETIRANRDFKKEEKEQKQKQEGGFSYEKTNKVLGFWKAYYKDHKELPSIAKTIGVFDLKEHEIKKARAELKMLGYYTDLGSGQIAPTKKFLDELKE